MKSSLSFRQRLQLLFVLFVVSLAALGMPLFLLLQHRIIDGTIAHDVKLANPILTRTMEAKSAQLLNDVQLVADLPTLRSTMSYGTPDPATVQQRSDSYLSNLRIDSYFITDDLGHVVASKGYRYMPESGGEAIDPSIKAGLSASLAGKAWKGVAANNRMVALYVSAPISVAGYVKGTINAFREFNATNTAEFAKDLTGGFAILQRGALIASSIPGVSLRFTGPGSIEAVSGNEKFSGTAMPFPGAAADSGLSVVPLRNYDEIVTPFRQIEEAAGIVLAAILLLASILSRLVAQRVLDPIERLFTAAKALRDGVWPDSIPVTRTDEIGTLENAFNEMSSSLKNDHDLILKQTDQLRDALQRAESAGKARTEFLSRVSHELRTPLNAAIGMGQVLQFSGLSGEQMEAVRSISFHCDEVLKLVNEVLDYAELESGKVSLSETDVELAGLLASLRENHAVAINAKGLQFRLEVDQNKLPKSLKTDARRVSQVLDHLLDNAVKFTSTGYVLVRADRVGQAMEISIQDSGCGVDASQFEEIFEPFRQGDNSSTRKHGGTGLGLAICRQVAELLGATLRISSTVGQGSTFTLALPLPHAESAPMPHPSLTLKESKVRVLIVDDNLMNLKVAAKVCERLGCETTCVDGGAGAIEAAQDTFDLILMDCHMPEVDGFQATREIRSSGIHTPILALTASNVEEDRRAAIESGMDGYWVKPLRPEMMMEILRQNVVPDATKLAA